MGKTKQTPRLRAAGKTALQKQSPQKPSLPKPSGLDFWLEILLGGFIVIYLLSVNLPGSDGKAGYSGLSPMKTTLFYVLAGCVLLYGLVRLCLELRQSKRSGTRLRPLTASQWTALAFLACTLLSAACSPYQEKVWYNETSHEAALTVSLYVLFFLAVSRWGRATKRLWLVFLWTMVPFCLLCLLQVLGENPLGLYPQGMNYYDNGEKYKGAYAATLGNVDIVSAFLALAIPLIVLPTLGAKLRKSWPCWVLALVCLGLLVWLQVLCGLVGLAMGAAVCLLVLCPAKLRKWVLLSYGVLAAAGLALLWFWDPPYKFLHELHEMLHGRFEDSFGTGRIYIWRQMLERIPERLWVGIGPDAVRFSGLSPFVRYDEAGKIVARATITDAHCYPLHILYCQGLPALLSWLATVGLVLTRWVKNRADRASAALGGGLVCFLSAMLFCFSSVIVMPFFWLTLGLIEAKKPSPNAG